MINKLIKKFKSIQSLGTDKKQTDDQSARIILTNNIALLLLLVATPYAFIFSQSNPVIGLMVIPCLILFIITPILNHFKKSVFAKYTLLLGGNLGAFLFASIFGKDFGIQFLFFAFIGVPALIFEPTRKNHMTIGAILPIACLTLLELTSYRSIITIQKLPIQPDFVYHTAQIAVMAIIFMCWKFFAKAIEGSHNKLLESRSLQETMVNQVAYAELVRGISHEIKNPLGLIMGRAELALARKNDQELLEEFASITAKTMDRLNHLIETLLDYSGQTETKISYVPINTLIEELHEMAIYKCQESGVFLEKELGENRYVLGDRHFLYQSLVNLLVNALQHTARGKKITMATEPTEFLSDKGIQMGVKISIIDTGKGIPPEKLKEIFTPYYTTQSNKNNAGLGLSIVQNIIKNHNGKIEVDSEVGKHTTFNLFLPAKATPPR